MAETEAIDALLEQFPAPAGNGTYVELDEEKIKRIGAVVAKVRAGGRVAVLALVGQLEGPHRIKARYALHRVAVEVTAPGAEADRAVFVEAIASQVNGDRPRAVRGMLIEALQVVGDHRATAALGSVLADPELCDIAARALAAIGDGAAAELLAALPKAQGRSRAAILAKLASLRCAEAAPAFREALADADPEMRLAGASGIARIADGSAADALLKCAESHEGWERNRQTDACLDLAEALAAAAKPAEAAAIYRRLINTRTSPAEAHIRAAAERGLATTKRPAQG